MSETYLKNRSKLIDGCKYASRHFIFIMILVLRISISAENFIKINYIDCWDSGIVLDPCMSRYFHGNSRFLLPIGKTGNNELCHSSHPWQGESKKRGKNSRTVQLGNSLEAIDIDPFFFEDWWWFLVGSENKSLQPVQSLEFEA